MTDPNELIDKFRAFQKSFCECGHDRDMHYGERGSGGCDERFDNEVDISCTCDGYTPKEK